MKLHSELITDCNCHQSSASNLICPSLENNNLKTNINQGNIHQWIPHINFRTIKLEKHELNHFEDNHSTIKSQYWSPNSEHEMAIKTKIQSF